MNNIIECKLESTYKEIFTGLWQHDYGQILRITGVEFPKAVEIQFSLNEKRGSTITRIGTTVDGVTEVQIPNELLKNDGRTYDYCIYAYIYLTDETSGSTEYEIVLHVKSRTKPENPSEEPLPEPNIFHETVAAVNASAERAETAEKNAKASEVEAGKYAASASESAGAAEKTKEDALKEVGEKKREAIEAIREQEETSVRKIINHTDNEIQRIQNQIANSKGELEQTIENASASNEELEQSIETASDTKTALDESTELAETAKTELDTSTQKAGTAKNALDESIEIAGTVNETLSATVKQAGALDTSLGEKIKTGTQLKTDLVASGEKAVQDIQNTGSEQLDKMQAVAEEFTADREQINVNKEDISILKEEMGKNYLDDAKTKRSLDALWKLNQGISYQFEADAEKAYQKDIPSGAKLVSIKSIGGRTIVWNQLFNYQNIKTQTNLGVTYTNNDDGTYTANGTSTGVSYISKDIKFIEGHKYYMRSLTTIGSEATYKAYITGNNIFNRMTDVGYGEIDTASITAIGYFVPLYIPKGTTVENLKIIPQIYDLTKMFGAGNEPSTPEEFEALFPEDYYPYNEGTLMSIPVNEVRNRGYSNIDISEFARAYPDKCNFSDGVLHILSANTNLFFRGIPVTAKTGDKLTVDIKCGTATNVRLRARLKTGVETDITSGVNDTEWNHRECVLSVDIVALMLNWLTAGTFSIRNLCVNGKPYYCEEYPIPQAILNLDGYGDGVSSDVYNYVDWENKKYHKRVGKVNLGTLNWEESKDIQREGNSTYKSGSLNTVIRRYRTYSGNSICEKFNIVKTNDVNRNEYEYSIANERTSYPLQFTVKSTFCTDKNDFKNKVNGIMLYYELAEPIVTDIADIIGDTFQEPLEVESGGTLTFKNSNGDAYRIPVQSAEEYLISLAEVAK